MKRFVTRLEPTRVGASPGQALRFRLRVYNSNDAVDQFTATGLGPVANWMSSNPNVLRLMPETDGELELTLLIPVDAALSAGDNTIQFRISSSLVGVEDQTMELIVDLAKSTLAELRVEPPSKASDVWSPALTSSARYVVHVVNRGNHPLSVALSAQDREAILRATIVPRIVQVPPHEVRTAELQVSTKRKVFGRKREYPILVEGLSKEIHLTARTAFVQKRWLAPVWMLAAALAVAALIGVSIFVVRGSNGPTTSPNTSISTSDLITVPDVSGHHFDRALAELTRAGFQRLKLLSEKSNRPLGVVTRTDPPAGTAVSRDREVWIFYTAPF